MDKKTLFEILTTRTVEEINDSINNVGKTKMVNGITFIEKKETNHECSREIIERDQQQS